MKRLLTSLLFVSTFLFVCAQLPYRFGPDQIKLWPVRGLYYVERLTSGESKGSIKREFSLTEDTSEDIAYKARLCVTEMGDTLIILPKIFMKLKAGQNSDKIILNFHGLLNIDTITASGIIKFNCLVKTDTEVITILEKLSEYNEISWCEPNVLLQIHYCNPLYNQQYYLKNTGQNGGTLGIDINVEPAWQITSGNPQITVAVVDSGVDKDHEDLVGSVLSGYTIGDPNGKGVPIDTIQDNEHGTACAGIIGARNNNIGIRGVASGVKILPVNNAPGFYIFHESDSIADAIRWAYQRSDILSCSWNTASSYSIIAAIDEATTMGRNGKGCIVVAAAGNSALNNLPVQFPAKLPNVIAVGAIDNTGTICPYSCRGADLNLVAPSGISNGINHSSDIVTTDRTGSAGYVNGDYFYHFSGTSAACPQVAGVSALMLSANSYLPEYRVREILQNTATHLSTVVPDTTFGYGLVNAGDAVAQAKAEKPSFSITKTYNGENEMTISVAFIPSYFTIEWTVLAGNMTISTTGSNYCTLTKSVSGLPSGSVMMKVKYGSSVIYSTVIGLNVSETARYRQEACTYYGVGHPAIPLTVINSGGQAHVHQGCRVYLNNQVFGLYQNYGNITHTGVTPDDWYVANDHVEFALPLGSGGIPFGVQVKDNNGTIKYQYIFFTYSGNGNNSLSVNPISSSEYVISLGEDDDNQIVSKSNDESLQTWRIEIYNTSDASKVYDKEVIGNKVIINTSGWRVGTYAIRATRGDQVYTEKMLVK